MNRYTQLQFFAVLAGLALVILNGFDIATTGPDVTNVPFFLLGLVVLVLGGDLAGKYR